MKDHLNAIKEDTCSNLNINSLEKMFFLIEILALGSALKQLKEKLKLIKFRAIFKSI